MQQLLFLGSPLATAHAAATLPRIHIKVQIHAKVQNSYRQEKHLNKIRLNKVRLMLVQVARWFEVDVRERSVCHTPSHHIWHQLSWMWGTTVKTTTLNKKNLFSCWHHCFIYLYSSYYGCHNVCDMTRKIPFQTKCTSLVLNPSVMSTI